MAADAQLVRIHVAHGGGAHSRVSEADAPFAPPPVRARRCDLRSPRRSHRVGCRGCFLTNQRESTVPTAKSTAKSGDLRGWFWCIWDSGQLSLIRCQNVTDTPDAKPGISSHFIMRPNRGLNVKWEENRLPTADAPEPSDTPRFVGYGDTA